MKTIALIFSMLGLLWTNSASNLEALNISKTESTVGWKAAKVTGEHWGKVKISSANLDYQNGRITSGSFEIDMTSITVEDIKDANSNARLTNHLKSDDFFSVEKFNKSSMTITEAKTSNGKDYEIKGNLVIKGISNPVTFPAQVTEEGNKVIATGKITFDRTKYDIKYRSGNYFENLADKLIYDEVTLEVKLVGMK
ncbi:YceI family protein [Belliella aquatica]|uniref:Polyisoprenoid-binding protein n=1 Tax=Belliella aquatica TaxID=1323734 RepID=A0ABQ1MIB0_9BACT|nr:YceI family protein [Belliella aquatica]MCH7405508.1 YceI family protein [Belliella aquatica]GGC40999.1 polyisoprenoid-binding protein [Belliella aquatica]